MINTHKEPVLIFYYFCTYPVKCRRIVSVALRVILLLLCHVHWGIQNNLFAQVFLHFSSFSVVMMIVSSMRACVRQSYLNCTRYVSWAILVSRQCSELFINSLSESSPSLDFMTENIRSFPQTIQVNCNTDTQSSVSWLSTQISYLLTFLTIFSHISSFY